MRDGVAITGLGALSAIGRNPAAMTESLREGRGGITLIEAFPTTDLRVHHAAELRSWQPTDHFSRSVADRLDRTAQFAIVAARQAVADAGLSPAMLRSGRVALVFGICAGGIGAPDGPGLSIVDTTLADVPQAGHGALSAAERDIHERHRDTALFAQTDAVAADLGLTGPVMTISTGCAASTSAMACALTLLRAGRVDAVVVGGADAWSRGIYAGFYSVGAMAEKPCSPFSRSLGVTFGEGAGCIVVEPMAAARARGAVVHASLLAVGNTSDAHHITSPNPSGQGLLRAMQLALEEAGLTAESVDYINAHGTGTADNDVAETMAVRRLFDGRTPPVSSSKSFFGHTLGAAGILEFIAAVLGMKAGFMPPTLGFEKARPGCDLDYIGNTARVQAFDTFLSTSAAFGGVNAVAVGGRADRAVPPPPAADAAAAAILVTGIGVVSPIGCGAEAFRAALLAGTPGIGPITRFATDGLGCHRAGLIHDFPARRLAPAADTRRMDLITRYAVVATTLALKDAGLAGRIAPERIGLHVAMSDGPTGSAQAFAEELERAGIAGLGAKYFPAIVFATVGGQIGQACRIRGASFTFMDGAGAGLQALAHGHDFLRQHPELDALVVIAADEVAAMVHRMQDRLGLLTAADELSLYDLDGRGAVPGEGSVALVLERAETAVARGAGPYGRIAGLAQGSEGRCDDAVDANGAALADVALRALDEAGGGGPDMVYGMARGAMRHDLREAAALRRVLRDRPVPVSSLNGQLGLAEATGGLYAAAAALLGLRHGEAHATLGVRHPVAGLDVVRGAARTGDFRTALVVGSSQHGNSAAVLFSRDF